MKYFVDKNTWVNNYNKSNPFGARDEHFYPKTTRHIGSDIIMPIGTKICAPCDGEIYSSTFSSVKGNVGIFIFEHKGTTWGLELCHLNELPIVGKYKEGEIIAISGNTGSATTGPHLHFVLHRDALVTKNYNNLINEQAFIDMVNDGRLVDPYKWFTDEIEYKENIIFVEDKTVLQRFFKWLFSFINL